MRISGRLWRSRVFSYLQAGSILLCWSWEVEEFLLEMMRGVIGSWPVLFTDSRLLIMLCVFCELELEAAVVL